MKKPTRKTLSNVLNFLLIIGTILIVIILGARSGDLPSAWQALIHADRGWVLGALISCAVFILFETLMLHVFYRFQHVQATFSASLIATLIGMFYSGITPAATGGQPMQVVAMSKRKVSGGVTSSALAVKFFCFQSALLMMGAALWLLFRDFVALHIGAARWFVYTGFLLNGSAVLLVILLCISRHTVHKILFSLLKLLCRVRLIRREALWRTRLENALSDFHESVRMITKHPLQLLVLLLIACVQVLGLMSVSYCVYRALGLSALSYAHILTLQLLLYIGAAFTPLPGASGAQEGGFYIMFSAIFPEGTLLGALLLWRFFTYYLPTLLGLGGVIFDSVQTIRANLTPTENESAQSADLP